MAGVDSLLRMLVQHGGDELRVATDDVPKMMSRGAALRLSIPPTDDATLRHLLGDLLSPAHEATLRAGGGVELQHAVASDQFAVTLQRRGTGEPLAIEVVFRRGVTARASTPAAVTPKSPPTAAPPSIPILSPAVAPRPRVAPSTVGEVSAELAQLLQTAASMRASDVHLFTGELPSLRVDGQLGAVHGAPDADVESLLSGVLDDAAHASLAAGRSADLALDVPGAGRVRVNIYRAGGRLAAAIRLLPRRAPRLSELNFSVQLEPVLDVPHGLVIVTGPTGSGKSATLAALAEEAVRRRAGVLISLEDPIEYTIRAEQAGLVRQRQIGLDCRDFPTGLRDALREDPDILLVGEMRDPETITLALTAAETGHLVLASLHSRSAASSVERIVDAYPPERQQQIRGQLADALRAVIAQRLVPRARGTGRVPAVEILRGTVGVASIIREGKTAQLASTIQSSRKEGMLPLEKNLADLVRAGEIERRAATAVANDPVSLASYL
jgi:twitching motility protein PilT